MLNAHLYYTPGDRNGMLGDKLFKRDQEGCLYGDATGYGAVPKKKTNMSN